MSSKRPLTRRSFLGALAAAGAGAVLRPAEAASQTGALIIRAIPSSKEALPVVGLGSWITFNVGDDEVARASCAEVMRAFFTSGGRMIDSSPMYGSAQAVIGYGLAKLGHPSGLFAADKVWISSGEEGPAQIEASRKLWGIPRFDLLQVHNLLAWEDHLATLLAMKAEGKLRYVGITTSHGRRHAEIEAILNSQPIDFVQATYNVLDREIEARILPLAADKGVAVIVNRPFRQGELIDAVQRYPLPAFAAEFGAVNWAQVLLKFIVAHPAVTCAIPATSKVDHLNENMGAASGALPDEAMRKRIVAHIEQL